MTEHKKISLRNARPASAGESLFERADGAFGLDGFAPVAPPKSLRDAPRPVRKVLKSNDADKVETPAEAKLREARAKAKAAAAPASAPVAVPAPAPVSAPVSAAPKPEADVPTGSPAGRRQSDMLRDAAPVAAPVAQPEPDAAPMPVQEDVAFGGKIHAIDRDFLEEQGMIVPDGEVTGLLEEFRIVKRQLLSDAREAGTAIARRMLVCSPHSGEGKTYCAVNLALALAAERDIEVLLVDADFPSPSVMETLGLEAERGFMDALSDKTIKPESLVMRTDIDGLFVLPAGNRTTSDAEYLASARTRDVLARLTESAPDRIVIFDTPPALAASPAAELAKHVGQAILVARADDTGRNALEDAFQLLSACPDIKLLLNAAQFSPSGRNFGSYGAYGE
ncbi:MAG: AAA family ATPase [Erythrobacter sp.]